MSIEGKEDDIDNINLFTTIIERNEECNQVEKFNKIEDDIKKEKEDWNDISIREVFEREKNAEEEDQNKDFEKRELSNENENEKDEEII